MKYLFQHKYTGFIFVAIGLAFTTCASAYTPPSSVSSALNSYRGYSDLTNAAGSMDIDTYTNNLITWQMDHGGFFKAYASKYVNAWNGSDAKSDQVVNGKELGTIDNNATIQEMRLLAVRYKATSNSTYKAAYKTAFQKSLGFILTSQQVNGSWPQMYPARGNYSDMATYNDNAMIRVMVLSKDIVDQLSPFDSDITTADQRTQLQSALVKSVDFALKTQIINNGVLTVWCAQHHPTTYAPVAARSYELASKSGSESAGIVWFLMNWPEQSLAVQNAVKGAIAWYKKNRVADLKFSDGNFFVSANASLWYRFYEVNSDDYFFCDRAGESTKTQDITKLSDDRRYGYQWAGDYGSKLLAAETAYLSAIPVLSSSSSVVSSSSAASSSSNATQAYCGSSLCSKVIQGEDFCFIQGIQESKNAGYMGVGYANAGNHLDSTVAFRLDALQANSMNLFIRYANGGLTSRSANLLDESGNLIQQIDFPSTGSWTSWSTISITFSIAQGNHNYTLKPNATDGLANLDWIGWLDAFVDIPANCNVPTKTRRIHSTLLQNRHSSPIWDLKGRVLPASTPASTPAH